MGEDRPLYCAAGLSRRSSSKRKIEKKKDTQQLFREFSYSSHSGLPHTQLLPFWWWCRSPGIHTQSPGENVQLNMLESRLLGNWAGGWLSAPQEGRKTKPISPQPAATSSNQVWNTRKTGLASLKPAGGVVVVVVFFLSNSFLILTLSSSLSFLLFYFFFTSFPLYLFFLPSFIYLFVCLNSHK